MSHLRMFQITWIGIAKETTAMTKSACLWPIGIFFLSFLFPIASFSLSYCWSSLLVLHFTAASHRHSTVSIVEKQHSCSNVGSYTRWRGLAAVACILNSLTPVPCTCNHKRQLKRVAVQTSAHIYIWADVALLLLLVFRFCLMPVS